VNSSPIATRPVVLVDVIGATSSKISLGSASIISNRVGMRLTEMFFMYTCIDWRRRLFYLTSQFQDCSPGIISHTNVEANEMPLDLRRRMLLSEYCLRVSSNAYNLLRSCIFSSRFTKFFDKNPTHVRPLGLRVSSDLSDIGFTQKNNLVTSVSSTPPWHLVTPTVDLSLSTLSKSVTSPEIYHSKFFEICEGLQDY